MADDKVQVEIGAKIDSLVAGVNAVKSKLSELQESASAVGDTVKGLAEIFGVAFSVVGLVEFVRHMGELGLEVERTMATLGTTAAQTVQLRGIAALTGTSMEGLSHSIERMALNLQRAQADALNPTSQALQVLGLRARDLIGIPTAEYIDKMHDAVSRFNPSMNLTASVMAIGGRGVAQIIPLLQLSSAEWKEMKEKVDAATEGFADAVPGMANTHARLTILELAVQSFGTRIFTVLKPGIDLLIDSFAKLFETLTTENIEAALGAVITWVQSTLRVLSDDVNGLADAVNHAYELLQKLWDFVTLAAPRSWIHDIADYLANKLGPAIEVLATGVPRVAEHTVTAFDAMTRSFTGTAIPLNELGFNFGKVETAADFLIRKLEELRGVVAPEGWEAAARGISRMTDQIVAAGELMSKLDAKAINFGAKDAQEVFKAKQQEIIIEAQQQLARQKQLYDLDVTNFSMSQAEKYQLTIAYTNRTNDIELAALTKIRDQYRGQPKLWEDAEKARVAATQKANTEILKLHIEEYKALRSEVGGYIDSFQSSWNSNLRDMLTGAKTVWQSVGLAFGDLIIYMIQQLEKKFIFEKITSALTAALYPEESAAYIAAQQAKTAAAGVGESQRAGIQATGLTASIGTYVTDAFASIGASLAKLFASLTAFFSFLGPAAPAAAMALVAGVGVTAYGMIKGFEVGTDYVPYTGLAMVHQGERIIPASQNVPGAMGTTTLAASFSIQAWDARSVQTWLINGGDKQIASAISKLMNRNPSARPSY